MKTNNTTMTTQETATKLEWLADTANLGRSNGILEALANISQDPDFYAPQCEIWGEGADEVLPIDFVNHQTLAVEAGLLKVVPFGVKDLYHLCQMAQASGKVNATLSNEIKRLCESAGWDFDGGGKSPSRLFVVATYDGMLYAKRSGELTYYDLIR